MAIFGHVKEAVTHKPGSTEVSRRERHYVNKSQWPEGIWKKEPDLIMWTDKATGLDCLIVRSSPGHLCGYVGVKQDHGLYKGDPDDLGLSLHAHGGVNFAGHWKNELYGTWSVDESLWYIGFDCGHTNDYSPNSDPVRDGMPPYRDQGYVEAEIRRLALQIHGMAPRTAAPAGTIVIDDF